METNLKTWQRVVIGLGLPSLICLVFLYMWSGIYGLRCFFYELTDLYCPGCGSSRTLFSLLHVKRINSAKTWCIVGTVLGALQLIEVFAGNM